MNVSHEEFVRVWQAASSRQDVAKHLKITAGAASSRAHYLRSLGVELKRFQKPTVRGRLEALKALAKDGAA